MTITTTQYYVLNSNSNGPRNNTFPLVCQLLICQKQKSKERSSWPTSQSWRPIWSNQTLHQCTHPFPSGTHFSIRGESTIVRDLVRGTGLPNSKGPHSPPCKWCCPALGNLMGLFLPDPLFSYQVPLLAISIFSQLDNQWNFSSPCAHGPQYHHCHHSALPKACFLKCSPPKQLNPHIKMPLERSSDFSLSYNVSKPPNKILLPLTSAITNCFE